MRVYVFCLGAALFLCSCAHQGTALPEAQTHPARVSNGETRRGIQDTRQHIKESRDHLKKSDESSAKGNASLRKANSILDDLLHE
jgi:hypothetical protein